MIQFESHGRWARSCPYPIVYRNGDDVIYEDESGRHFSEDYRGGVKKPRETFIHRGVRCALSFRGWRHEGNPGGHDYGQAFADTYLGCRDHA